MRNHLLLACALASLPAAVACDDPTSAGGEGTARFTTWGEDYVEKGIGPDPQGKAGFYDGWSVRYEKFLVTFHAITVADAAGETAAELAGSRLVDNTRAGRKELVRFEGLSAKAYERVSFQIKPALPDTVVVGGTDPADRDFMAQNGYSIYVAGSASKVDDQGQTVTKTFRWGFTTATQYSGCHAVQSGKDTPGLVVTTGNTDTTELTTHGDHFFYDRLQEDPNAKVPTRLRFQEKADADANGDGEITLAELEAADLDATRYNPTPFPVTTLGGFVEALSRTVGHFRGEGECSVSKL